jgi:hypothetical protein
LTPQPFNAGGAAGRRARSTSSAGSRSARAARRCTRRPAATGHTATGTYVCKHRVESSGVCAAPAIFAPLAEYRVLEHLRSFVGDVDEWLGQRAADREAEEAERDATVTQARDELANLERKVMRAQQRADAALDRDDDELADAALRQVTRVEQARDAQARRVQDAIAVAAEFAAAPEETAAADFCVRLSGLSDMATGALVLATIPPDEIARALADALASITLHVEDGSLRADFQLAIPDSEGTCRSRSQ